MPVFFLYSASSFMSSSWDPCILLSCCLRSASLLFRACSRAFSSVTLASIFFESLRSISCFFCMIFSWVTISFVLCLSVCSISLNSDSLSAASGAVPDIMFSLSCSAGISSAMLALSGFFWTDSSLSGAFFAFFSFTALFGSLAMLTLTGSSTGFGGSRISGIASGTLSS